MWSLRWHFTNKSVTGHLTVLKVTVCHTAGHYTMTETVPSWGRGGTVLVRSVNSKCDSDYKRRYMHLLRPHPSTRGTRIFSIQRTMEVYVTSPAVWSQFAGHEAANSVNNATQSSIDVAESGPLLSLQWWVSGHFYCLQLSLSQLASLQVLCYTHKRLHFPAVAEAMSDAGTRMTNASPLPQQISI